MNHNKQPENRKYFQAALRFVGFVTQPTLAWHWAKSSADAESALTKNKVPSDVLDYFGISKKGSKWK